jgi:hypothetical protein
MLTSVEGNAVQAFSVITELETSALTENKRMTNHNTPQRSQMDLANHCAAFPGLSCLNTRAVQLLEQIPKQEYEIKALADNQVKLQPKTFDSYRTGTKALAEKRTEFHSYKLKED